MSETPRTSPKSRLCSPGGEDGDSASSTPAPNSVVTTTATAVSRPMAGTWPAAAIASAATSRPAAPPSSSGMPVQRGDDEPRQQRVGQRLGAVGEVVEDDPAARARRRSTPSSATSSSARRPTGSAHGSVSVCSAASISAWWWWRRHDRAQLAAGQLDDLAAVGGLEHVAVQRLGSGAPKATWRRLRHSTLSHPRAWSTSWVAIISAAALGREVARAAPRGARRSARRAR